MKSNIEKLQEEILKLHNEKESTGSQIHFDKCCYKIYEKERELIMLGGSNPLN